MDASADLSVRVPEPELMNEELQVQAYAEADFSESDHALVDWIAKRWPQGLGPMAVDLGCGPGNISLLLVQRWRDLKVVGIDGAPQMLAVAAERQNHLKPQVSVRLQWQQACLQNHELGCDYSGIVSNSLLHHLHDPQVLWQTLPQLGIDGAAVVIHDLRRPEDESVLKELIDCYAADAPSVLKRDYEASLRAAFTAAEVESQLREAGLEYLEVLEREDRYLTVAGVLRSPG